MTDKNTERRKSDRVDARLKLEVKMPRDDGSQETATLETINISSSGIYFKTDHFIEPMTKLAMVLEVSVPSEGGADEFELAPVPCEGIVVRIRPETSLEDCSEYEVAVFFTNIDAVGSANLEKHISLLIENPA